MKLKIHLQIFLLTILTGFTFSSYSQQRPDSLKLKQSRQQQHLFYRRTLQVDSAKAVQVTQIQDSYKTGLKAVLADTALNEDAKRAKISALMELKNQKLRQLLSPAQQAKIIPTTERMSSKAAKQP